MSLEVSTTAGSLDLEKSIEMPATRRPVAKTVPSRRGRFFMLIFKIRLRKNEVAQLVGLDSDTTTFPLNGKQTTSN